MGIYRCSDGSKISQEQLDRRIRKAKAKKLQEALDKYGYIFCEVCKRNDCKPVDCSHDISVNECKNSGRAELAYEVTNITLRGRDCHNKHDNSGIQWTQHNNS